MGSLLSACWSWLLTPRALLGALIPGRVSEQEKRQAWSLPAAARESGTIWTGCGSRDARVEVLGATSGGEPLDLPAPS